MTNRREFIKAGMVATALPLAVGDVLAPGESMGNDARQVSIHKAVFDDRYAEGRLFAEHLGARGVPARALDDGDVTSFWFDELDLIWRQRPVAIAGLTQFGPMFVLERLARERGMRIALRVEHRPEPGDVMRHVMSGPTDTVALAARLGERGVAWPALMAAAVAGCNADCSNSCTETLVMSACARPEIPANVLAEAAEKGPERIIHYYTTHALREGRPLPLDGPLFSWVIAPKTLA